MAEMAAIGWPVSPIIKEMISKAKSYLGNKYNWSSRMKDDLKTLESTMMEILVVVSNAERWKISDSNLAMLLTVMKEAVYDAEDVMDEFNYAFLKSKTDRQGKAVNFASCSCDVGKHLLGLDPLRKNLSKALKSLERVKSSANRLLDVAKLENAVQQPDIKPWRLTSYFSSEDTFIGCDNECKEIVRARLDHG